MFIEKIKAALKTKYKSLGFSEKAFDGVASYLDKTVTKEEDIETATGGVESLFKAFQGEVDIVRTSKSGLEKQFDEYKKEHPEETPPADVPPITQPAPNINDPATFAKMLADASAAAIQAQLKPLQDKITGFEQQTAAEKRQAEITSAAKSRGIPDKMLSILNVPNDTNLDDYFKGVQQTMADEGFKLTVPPAGGSAPVSNEAEIANSIREGTKQIVEQKK